MIKSIGIDIGTSTSKLIISELTLGRISSHFSLPHFAIVERKVTYESKIISTPLKNAEEIDLKAIVSWLEAEYQQLGLSMSDLKSGAVIITGETAIKKNADAFIHYLAERSGDFVVAIAGASLEGVLAGKGSGAYDLSRNEKGCIANIDIGGGTANVAIFQHGKLLETITFHVGGRLIEINEVGDVLAISPSLQPWLVNKKICIANQVSFEELSHIAKELCKDMLEVLFGKQTIESQQALVHSSTCSIIPTIDVIMVSGGIGRLIDAAAPNTMKEAAKFHDFGPILASELATLLTEFPVSIVKANETSRATVIGAGMQTTELSGSTISIERNLLPLRNIPVVKITVGHVENTEDQIDSAMKRGKELYTSDQLPFALYLSGLSYVSYEKIKHLAMSLSHKYVMYFPQAIALIVICESDMAKALGQSLILQKKSSYDVICIDQVYMEQGDYIDIGEPINESLVPVVVKTLAFS